MELSHRITTVTPSPTLAISAKATELKRQGHDVISLSLGEPDFHTPDYIIKAAETAMHTGLTKYTATGGIPELKQAIINKFATDNDLMYTPEEVIVTSGAKHALYALFQSILNQGDEVIVPTPYWVSYPEQVKLAGGKPVYVEAYADQDFKVTPEQIEAVVTAKTKALIINSPSNPTGVIYSKEELAKIGEVCLKHDILIVSDEIYEKLIYGETKHFSIAQLSEDLKKQTVVINGVSKSHAMTGWRIGYAAGDRDIIKAMTNHASHSTSNPMTVAQYAALAAYEEESESIAVMNQHFSERLDRFYELITAIPGVTCVKPEGAFYLFPDVSHIAKQSGFKNVDEWVAALLEAEKVALIPGSGFGAPDYVRLSYATSMELLEEAAKRIKRFVTTYQS